MLTLTMRTVPVVRDGELVVPDALAMVEYIAERFPQHRVWPQEPHLRARARAG